MAAITIRIEDDGVPVEGVEVTPGSFAERSFLTDVNGEITRNVEDNFKVAVCIIAEWGGVSRIMSGPRLLEAGGVYVLDMASSAPV